MSLMTTVPYAFLTFKSPDAAEQVLHQEVPHIVEGIQVVVEERQRINKQIDLKNKQIF